MGRTTRRGTGRTTGLALQAIGRACAQSGAWFRFADHYRGGGLFEARAWGRRVVEALAARLGLRIEVRDVPGTRAVEVRSPWTGVEVPR